MQTGDPFSTAFYSLTQQTSKHLDQELKNKTWAYSQVESFNQLQPYLLVLCSVLQLGEVR